ncbi:AraC family transcriptional regulator [Gracilibacillus sp. YIM 98692]|uniref:AraC family transcriptional regulator n=1 Tax=Gracilibacillus sp. YIM 98692 TaxID=2663532 RepID=UPI0013D8948C|nr:AraC family transcriptional regulator [Gracilibacillus sp. YIM 98692]
MVEQLRDSHLRTLWISRIDYRENSGVNTHTHEDFFQLIVIIDGEGSINIGNKEYSILSKCLYFIPKGVHHSFHFTKDSTTIDFKFQILSEKLESLVYEIDVSEPYLVGSLLNNVKEVFKLSIDHLRYPDPILLYRIEVEFKAFFLSYLQGNSMMKEDNDGKTPLVNQEIHSDFPIIEYLNEHLQSKISLEDIANHFNFHPHYLIELFRKKLGTTPMNFLQQLRVEKSKEHLEFTNYTISEIADLVGLTAPYFSRLFKSVEGVSPTEYREQSRSVIGKDIVLEQDFLSYLEKQPPVL